MNKKAILKTASVVILAIIYVAIIEHFVYKEEFDHFTTTIFALFFGGLLAVAGTLMWFGILFIYDYFDND